MIIGKLKEREWGWRPGPKASPIYFWEEVDLIKESWQARARPPRRLKNSWKSSCPSESRSSFFIMRSRTPGSFWFFVKAPSSLFMKIRNSALESLQLLPSLPACLWKTAIRDSMHRSVSVGLDIFAMFGEERSTGLWARSGEARTGRWAGSAGACILTELSLLWSTEDQLRSTCSLPWITYFLEWKEKGASHGKECKIIPILLLPLPSF